MSRTGITRNEDGAAAVEFALVSTVLFLLLFGIIEFGQAYSQYQVFQGAAREGARLAAVRTAPSEVIARVKDAAAPYVVNGKPMPDVSIEGSTLKKCDATTVGKSVTVKWRQIFDIQLPFVPPIDTRTWISAVFKCE